jgi:DnaJ-class molecular chaperone
MNTLIADILPLLCSHFEGEKESYPGGYTFNQAMAKTIFEKFFGGPNPYDGVFIRQPKLAGQSPFDAGLDGVSGMKQWKGKIQKRCEDKVHKLMVTLEELYSGAYKKASLQRQVRFYVRCLL